MSTAADLWLCLGITGTALFVLFAGYALIEGPLISWLSRRRQRAWWREQEDRKAEYQRKQREIGIAPNWRREAERNLHERFQRESERLRRRRDRGQNGTGA